MASNNRPLSPHLDVYRLPLTAIISISHRITGVGLSAGTLLLACWLIAAATGVESYDKINAFLGSWFGMVLLFLWSFAFFFHLSNGLRHLFWDTGRGLDKADVEKSAKAVIISAAALTVLTWFIALVGGAS